jgi:phosphoglycerol transferase MdoB-like AlkP superfamily enzyme
MPSGSFSTRLRAAFLETRYGVLVILLGLLLGVSFLTRLGLLALDQTAASGSMVDVLQALLAGLVVDVLVALWLLAPLALFLTAIPEHRIGQPAPRRVLYAIAGTLIALALFTAIAEVLFFAEFNGRFNFVAVDYLIYPTEVVTNIWESYHAAWAVLAIVAGAAGILYLIRGPLARSFGRPMRFRERLAYFGIIALTLLILSAGVSPSTTRVSDDRALNEIATNGFYSFWQTLLGVDAPYAGLYATADAPAVFQRLRRLLAEPATDTASWHERSTLRHVRAVAARRPMNVVVVLEESLGSEFIGILHPRPTSLTPHFDSLAAEGTLLIHAYSTGNRTIRALEATTSSLPPLPGIATVRRPQSENLFTLPAVLRQRGYQTRFIYGGRALFDGMGRYMIHNGVDRVIEQSDYPEGTFSTAWGVADEAIFDRALAEMDTMHAAGKPFYTLILTVSNHRPYLYPKGRIAADPEKKWRVNAVQYADWALGRFVRAASARAYFDNTLFVLMGDHGARVYGASEIPLPSYEVPVLFYAPRVIPAGRRLGTLASSLDMPPTILGVLGGDYETKFFGHDLFRVDSADGRALLTHNNAIALMRGGRLAVLGLREAADVYQIADSTGTLRHIANPDSAGRALLTDAIAYFTGADLVYRGGAYRMPAAGLAGR